MRYQSKLNMNLYDILEKLDIAYSEVEHAAAYTVNDMKNITISIEGIGCKNLFLKDKKDNFYLYVLPDEQRANIKEVANVVGVKNLSFANESDLEKILNLKPGSVTPFGIINDVENRTLIILDSNLKNNYILIHPLVNTKTLSIYYDDLIKFINYLSHQYICI